MDAELQMQIDLRAEALEREGMSPSEARAEALRRFGDLDEAARYCVAIDREAQQRRRASGWVDELRQDVGHTLRILRRGPAFAAATVLTLGIAIGASTAVYGVLHTFLIRPLPFPESERLVAFNPPPQDRSIRQPSMENVDWSTVDSLFDATAAWDLDGFTVVGDPYPETVTGAWVSPGYFEALSLHPALGRRFREREYRARTPVAIISHELWVRRFGGDPAAVGRTFTAHSADRPDAATRITIVGVTPRDFWPIHWRESHILRPLPPDNRAMPALARLEAGASLVATQQRLDAVVRAQISGPIEAGWHMRLVPSLEQHSARAKSLVMAVFGAAMFMLLAACGSVAGALVSRIAARRSELAVRVALGGRRTRIARQLLTESAVLTTLAGALGLAIAYALLSVSGPLVEQQLGTKVPGGVAALRPSMSVLAPALLASTVIGLLLGLLPALTFLHLDRRAAPHAALGGGRSSVARGGAGRVRRVLIAGQVAVAMVLMFGAGLMFRTVARMASTELGFRTDGVLAASTLIPLERYLDSTSKRLLMDRLLARVAETPGVRNVATVAPRPFVSSWGMNVLYEGGPTDEEATPRAALYTVSPTYFETMDISLRAGRSFRPTDDVNAPRVVVISESLARTLAPTGDVIGRRVRVRVPYLTSFDDEDDRPWRTVIGVVTDTKKSFTGDAMPDIYVPYAQNPRSSQSFVVRTDRGEETMIEPVRRAFAGVEPGLALSGIESMAKTVANAGGQRRGLTVLLGVFAVFALALSVLALYASLSYTVIQRQSELAVRMAIGASARSILRLVAVEGLASAGVGVAVGAVASVALGRVLQNQVYGVGTGDPVTLLTISLVLALGAVAACAIPGVRATRTDPARVLRE
ncbi:MAG TPA: ADOP family duplicated permease [Gemmatimonadaceae bacterium]|nr:ADOP family duplicated permease [Gemmatimonadaceae bacterium]